MVRLQRFGSVCWIYLMRSDREARGRVGRQQRTVRVRLRSPLGRTSNRSHRIEGVRWRAAGRLACPGVCGSRILSTLYRSVEEEGHCIRSEGRLGEVRTEAPISYQRRRSFRILTFSSMQSCSEDGELQHLKMNLRTS